jgi:hypothetical protein
MIPPIDLRDDTCAWRKEDGIQRCRINIPEPTHTGLGVYLCMVAPPPILSYAFQETPTPLDFQPIRQLEMRKQVFSYGPRGENQFWGWTVDGRTPIFPIPMEEEI